MRKTAVRCRSLGLDAWLLGLTVLFGLVERPAMADERMHTFDGKHDIARVEVTVVYLVPSDRAPLPDWRVRVDYFARRIEAFHAREFGGQSSLETKVHPEPLRLEKTSEQIRGNDPNQTFYNSTGEARRALKWPGTGERKAFPILLVLSDINWRELDDFHRVRVVDGVETHEGNIGEGGRHFPGAESGGARATYNARSGLGLGLVSADGWRVPYTGSDCVVYHEGVGHSIGLPHPSPIDGSVMGVAQYEGWLNQTYVNESQKKKLGWNPTDKPLPGLFDVFTAIPRPSSPSTGKPVLLDLKWPGGSKVKSLKVLVQTELTGPWREVPVGDFGRQPAQVSLGFFEKATPVSYRVLASLEDGQGVELWGYFQVK